MINAAGLGLISSSESIQLTAYLCPAGVPTIGRGHTKGVTMDDVKNKKTITIEEERKLFQQDMLEWEHGVLAVLTRTPNENQLAAMVSLAFNIGIPAFTASTVCKAFNKGDDAAAAQAFGLWNKITIGGKKVVNNGLVARRARETALYLKPVNEVGTVTEPAMPQEVAPPVTMTGSKINKAAILGSASAGVALVTDVVNKLNDFKEGFDKLGHWAVPILLVGVICFGGWTLYERLKLRRNGVV